MLIDDGNVVDVRLLLRQIGKTKYSRATVFLFEKMRNIEMNQILSRKITSCRMLYDSLLTRIVTITTGYCILIEFGECVPRTLVWTIKELFYCYKSM